jgi:hypothetical protein
VNPVIASSVVPARVAKIANIMILSMNYIGMEFYIR